MEFASQGHRLVSSLQINKAYLRKIQVIVYHCLFIERLFIYRTLTDRQ